MAIAPVCIRPVPNPCPPGNGGIVPPYLREPWATPVGPDVPRVFCDHDYLTEPDVRGACRDCWGVS